MTTQSNLSRVALVLTLAVLSVSCKKTPAGTPDLSVAGGGDAAAGDGAGPANDGTSSLADALGTQDALANDATLSSDGWNPTNQPGCAGKIYACSDGQDNDKDGLADAQDPECVGPCDNDEASFATGIAGDNVDACKQDCFFDGNSGQGEKCEWNLKCDPKSPGANLAKACPYDPNFGSCPSTEPQACLDACLPFAPNGCDCFGCCQVFAGGISYTIFLGSGTDCSTATPQKCAPCTPVAACNNPCEECELCLGKTLADLPAKCFPATADGGPTGSDGGATGSDGGGSTTPPLPSCSGGAIPCLTNAQCPTGRYCLTGCCTTSGID